MKRIIAFLLAFVLTGTLVLFGMSFVIRQVIAPAMDEDGAQVSGAVIRAEKKLAEQRISTLADLYGFSPDPVIALVDDATLRELNAQASRWWSSVLNSGKPGHEIEWNPATLEEILISDRGLAEGSEEDLASLAESSAGDIRKSITRMVLPMRQQVIRLGLKKAAGMADLKNIVTSFLKIPWAALALCVLLAGLIALLEGKRKPFARVYIGSALGGAAILLTGLAVLVLCAGIQPMIREASLSLDIQVQDTVARSMVRTGILAAVMAAGCVLCLARKRKGQKAV